MIESVDINFSVPCRHRLHLTEDVTTSDAHVLLDALEGEGRPAKVQIWLDSHVARANPTLASRLETLIGSRPGKLKLTDPVGLIEGGEACKNDRELVHQLLTAMDNAGLDRRSYVVVIGGGAVLDAVGFAAAVAHRGIRLIRLPTTVLGQADSGVGVKNAVNLFGKKNWMGTFAVPWAVINDLRLLETLPDRDFVSGFSEAVKVALLKSRSFFLEICKDAKAIRDRDMQVAAPVIAQSAKFHLSHITRGGDPFEVREARPLDYGHWSAHKLEPMSDFRLRHGEAVSIGVAIDTVYSSLVHDLPQDDAERVLRCLYDLGIPLADALLIEQTDALFRGLEEFRQHLGGRLTVTMLNGVGEPIDVHEIDHHAMRVAIERVCEIEEQLKQTDPHTESRNLSMQTH